MLPEPGGWGETSRGEWCQDHVATGIPVSLPEEGGTQAGGGSGGPKFKNAHTRSPTRGQGQGFLLRLGGAHVLLMLA